MKPLVFMHGWAQSQQIWFQQHELFEGALFLNLPGHGGQPDLPADQWADYLLTQLPEEPSLLLGWSLGGMLAMQLAHLYPERVDGLALVSTTPRFRADDNWPHGSSDKVFNGFRQAIESGSPKALNRFFALMLHGDEITRSDFNRLAKAAVDRENRVSEAGVKGALELLESVDLREQIATITQPTLVIHGEADAIVPCAAGLWLTKHIPDNKQLFLPDCGHAPFLTQPEQFNSTLHTWWQTQ